MAETSTKKNLKPGGLPDDLAAGLKLLPAGITPSAEKGINPRTTRDYRVDDPMNQAAVDRLLNDVICQERATMATGARLYIVMGETHDMPSLRMTQSGLLDNLCAAPDLHGSLMLALELPYNFLQQYLEFVYHTPIPEPLKKTFHERDPLGHHFARTVLANNQYPCAPQSKSRLLGRALTHQLPIVLCDAAYGEHRNLDPVDDLAQEIAESERFQFDLANENIFAIGIRGMNIRNAVMARRAVETAQAKHVKADTIVMQTGIAHLGGNMLKGLDYDTSLTALLKEEIRPQDRVLSVFFSFAVDDAPERIVPPDMWQDNPDHIIIRNFCDESYQNYETDEENDCIRRLGDSYLAQEFGGVVPDRFQSPELPTPQSIKEEARRLIASYDL